MVVLSGCSVEQQTKLAHVKGTLAWMRGDWNDAVLYFYEAESLATELPDTEMQSYTDFAHIVFSRFRHRLPSAIAAPSVPNQGRRRKYKNFRLRLAPHSV